MEKSEYAQVPSLWRNATVNARSPPQGASSSIVIGKTTDVVSPEERSFTQTLSSPIDNQAAFSALNLNRSAELSPRKTKEAEWP